MSLLKQQLKLSRTNFAQNKKLFDLTMSTLKELLNDTYYDKLLSFNISTSHRCHAEHLHKHKKKFQNLIDQHKVPYINPYDSIKVFDISAPSFTGIISQQKPVIREEINVVRTPLSISVTKPLKTKKPNSYHLAPNSVLPRKKIQWPKPPQSLNLYSRNWTVV